MKFESSSTEPAAYSSAVKSSDTSTKNIQMNFFVKCIKPCEISGHRFNDGTIYHFYILSDDCYILASSDNDNATIRVRDYMWKYFKEIQNDNKNN